VTVGGKWGYLNGKGEVVIEAKFADAKIFDNGRALVNIGGVHEPKVGLEMLGGKWLYIDTTGAVVGERVDEPEKPEEDKDKWDSPPRAHMRWCIEGNYHEDFARIRGENGLYGFVDRGRRLFILPRFQDAGVCSEGRIDVSCGGYLGSGSRTPFGKSGFIDKIGRLVIPYRYDKVLPFFDGLAWFAIGCTLEGLNGGQPLADGYGGTLRGGIEGYVNRKGEEVWPKKERGRSTPQQGARRSPSEPSLQQHLLRQLSSIAAPTRL